jgi:3'-5' exoribonuclease
MVPSRMSSASLAKFPTVMVRDFSDGIDVDQVLLVRAAEARAKRDGGEYLRLTLADRTGSVVAMVWDDVERMRALCPAGQPVHVRGRFRVHARFGAQIDLAGIGEPEPGSFDPADLFDGPPVAADRMEADLRALVGTIQEPHLRTLLERVLGEGTRTWELYRRAPAAKHYHQAYEHGLLEHCLSVAQGVSAISATFPGIDRDVAVTGALLHDIGKLEAYTADPAAIDLTDSGRLQGEIPLGYYRIRREIEEIDGFPPRLAEALLHIILSHHGQLEHGSPVVPCTREATLVHFLDNLGGRLGSFDRLEKELPAGAAWSGYDRALGGSAFFGAAAEAAQRLEAA